MSADDANNLLAQCYGSIGRLRTFENLRDLIAEQDVNVFGRAMGKLSGL